MTTLIGYLGSEAFEDARIKAAAGRVGKPDSWSGPNLAESVVMSALAGLQDEGSISMEYIERKRLRIFTSRKVKVTKIRQTAFPEASLEHALSEHGLFSDEEVSSPEDALTGVWDALDVWMGEDVNDPDAEVLYRVIRSLQSLGALDEQGDPWKTAPNRQVVQQLLPQLASWSERMNALFETKLAEELRSAAVVGIEMKKKEKPESDSDGGFWES
jgi:hypothetical protein